MSFIIAVKLQGKSFTMIRLSKVSMLSLGQEGALSIINTAFCGYPLSLRKT
jgi:hypothetical protein